jgi:hypothetical protein
MEENSAPPSKGKGAQVLLWIAAVLILAGAAFVFLKGPSESGDDGGSLEVDWDTETPSGKIKKTAKPTRENLEQLLSSAQQDYKSFIKAGRDDDAKARKRAKVAAMTKIDAFFEMIEEAEFGDKDALAQQATALRVDLSKTSGFDE